MDLYAEFRAVIEAIEAAGIEYAVAGALALAAHGAPRATKDIDVLIRPEDLERTLEAAATLGFSIRVHPMRFRSSGVEIQRVSKIAEGDLLTLDLMVAEGPFESAWASRVRIDLGWGMVWVVGREALIEMKLKAGRHRDLADVERLESNDEEEDS